MRHSAGTWSGKTSEVPAFRMGGAAETASQNIALERDALSEPASKRKPHPALMWGLQTKAGP